MTATASETVQTLLQQLYEDEGVTSALTDEAAKALLEWGESQLNSVTAYDNKEVELEQMARQLRRVMRPEISNPPISHLWAKPYRST